MPVLSRRSFDAIVGETTSIGEVSLVGLTFSDENSKRPQSTY